MCVLLELSSEKNTFTEQSFPNNIKQVQICYQD